MAPETPWPFILGALSIVPLAGLIGHATEELADHSGPTLGGFLNATFGNAAEIIIGLVALRRRAHRDRAGVDHRAASSATCCSCSARRRWSAGSGACRSSSTARAANNATIMLFLGVVALIMPAVFDLTLYGRLDQLPPAIYHLSLWTSILLIVAYAGSLVYSFTTGRSLIAPPPAHGAEASRRLPAAGPAARRGHGAHHRAGRGAGRRRVAGPGERSA